MRTLPACVVSIVVATCVGCVVTPQDRGEVGRGVQALSEPGPWRIPESTLAIGDVQFVPYEGAGPWLDGEGCAGGIESGAAILAEFLFLSFPQVTHIGGYSCRPVNGSPTVMSVHGTGRALDVFIPTVEGSEADNDLGDPIGNWLIENSETLGVQYIIWDEWTWMASRPVGDKGRMYGGAHPHNDHLHVELSVAAATQSEDWFSDVVSVPAIPGCESLPPAGGVIDELDPCFQAFGPWEYWRSVDDAGYGGSLLYTNAFSSIGPSNWARWNISLERGERYHVDVYLAAPFNVHRETRYAVRAGEIETEIILDQSAATGWVTLGEFEFAAGDQQWIAVYDHSEGDVPPQQHIVVDAVRLVHADAEGSPAPDDGGVGSPDDDDTRPDLDGDPSAGTLKGGCAASGRAPADGGAWLVLTLALVAFRRTRSRGRAMAKRSAP